MIRRPPRSTRVRSSAASDVYKRQVDVANRVYALVLRFQRVRVYMHPPGRTDEARVIHYLRSPVRRNGKKQVDFLGFAGGWNDLLIAGAQPLESKQRMVVDVAFAQDF